MIRCLALAVLVLLGPMRLAVAWDRLEAAVRLLPEADLSPGRRLMFEYADIAALRQDGDPASLLALGHDGDPWGPLVRRPEAVPESLGVAPERVQRVLLAGSLPTLPLTIVWGDPGFADAAGERLRARDFTVTEREGSRLYARWPDDHLDITTAEPSDPFAMSGQPQRILAVGNTLAATIDAEELLQMEAQRQRGEASQLGQAMLATIAPLRATLPRGINILQAAAYWPEGFDRSESLRRETDPARPERALPPDVWPGDPRLPPFAFALFLAAELNDLPVLILAVAYGDERQAEFAAPLIAEAVRTQDMGPGEPPTRVHDWALGGRGVHVAAVTVLFGAAPRSRASTALQAWLTQVRDSEFLPLDLLY